jgi:hypothetical protein
MYPSARLTKPSVGEKVVFVDDEIPTVGAVFAAIREDLARLREVLGIKRLHEVCTPPAIDAHDDGVNRHASTTVCAQTPYSGSPGPGGVHRREHGAANPPASAK